MIGSCSVSSSGPLARTAPPSASGTWGDWPRAATRPAGAREPSTGAGARHGRDTPVDGPDVRRRGGRLLARCSRSASPSPRSRRALGELEANLARHHELLDEARAGRRPGRLPRARADRLPAPGPRAEVAMRLDDPRLTALAGATEGCRRSSRSSRSRPTIGCSSPPRCSRTARSGTSTASSTCRPTACSTSGASSRRRRAAGRPSRLGVGVGIAVCEDFWHLSVPSCWRSTVRRCSSTSRRRRDATWPPPTRWASGRRPRGGRSCGRTPS